jgi:hypothetical protein
MSTITTKDGATIYYKDWGTGPVVTFSHGWPLNSDMWDGQMLFLAQQGFRVVAHDRRGHGRSSQAWSGNHMDGYADDQRTRNQPESGWVAMWRPMEIFLYDWWPIRAEATLADRLNVMPVRISYKQDGRVDAWQGDWPATSPAARTV